MMILILSVFFVLFYSMLVGSRAYSNPRTCRSPAKITTSEWPYQIRRWPCSNRLECAQAKESGQSIEPTTYRDDLYDVLGVSTTATSAEIKKNYLKIVAMNHPDRNSTQEALMIFRNATRAYGTLKDPKLRSKFDTKIRTKEAITTLEIVGTEVFETARPIVSGAAKAVYEDIVSPLSASAVEVTSAALKASIAVSADNKGTSPSKLVDFEGLRDRWKTAESTFSIARLQKRKEMTAEQLAKADDVVDKAQSIIDTSIEVLKKLNSSICTLAAEEKQRGLEVEASTNIYRSETARLTECQARLDASQMLLDEKQRSLIATNVSLSATVAEKDDCIRRVDELESQLRQLKEDRASLEVAERKLQGEVKRQSSVTEQSSKQVYMQAREVDSLEKTVAAARRVFEEKNSALQKSREARIGQEQSQKEQLTVERIQRKILTQTLKKKEALEATLRAVKSQERESGA